MTRTFSKPPSSLRAAFDADKQHALSRHRRGVERIAELMGVMPATLYKWLEECRMPAIYLPAWEHATGGAAVISYLAAQGHRLVIDIPHGKAVVASDVTGLQRVTHHAVGVLMAFGEGAASADDTVAALMQALQGLAWHRANVLKAAQPELDLDA